MKKLLTLWPKMLGLPCGDDVPKFLRAGSDVPGQRIARNFDGGSVMRGSICVMVALLVFASGQTYGESLSDNLIGYWQFDGSGQDASGGGRDLDLVGGVGFADGLFGEALDLHGNANQYAQRPVDDAIYDFGPSDFTIQAWVNFNNISGEQALVDKHVEWGGSGWIVTKHGVSDWHFFAKPSVILTSSDQTIQTGRWHHVLVRGDGSDFDLFYNGTVVTSGSDPDPIADTDRSLIVGMQPGRGFPLDGRLDEIAIWNRALTDSEIATLYNGGNGTPIPEPSTAVLAAMACVGLLAFGCRRLIRKAYWYTVGSSSTLRATGPEAAATAPKPKSATSVALLDGCVLWSVRAGPVSNDFQRRRVSVFTRIGG